MYSIVKDWRSKRTMMFDPSHYSVETYYTDIHQKKEMKHSFGDDLLNNLHLLPDPLRKNLADSIVTSEESKQKPNKNFLNVETSEPRFVVQEPVSQPETPIMASLSGITNFFSGVMNVITSAMFHRRPQSPAKSYDCFDDTNVSREGSPAAWQPSNDEDRNKNERAPNLISNAQTVSKSDMNKDCRSAAAQCEDKLNKVRLMLSTKTVEAPKFRSRRPRKVFVEPGSVEESFEDAFSPEDFVSLSNNTFIEYYSPCQNHHEEMVQTDSPKTKTEVAPVHETTEIVKTLPVLETVYKNCTDVKNIDCKSDINCKIVNNQNSKVDEKVKSTLKVDEMLEKKSEVETTNTPKETDKIVENPKEQLISSCEDKLSKLKALLQERRKKNTKTITMSSDSALESMEVTNDKAKPTKNVPIERMQDKRFKNPCRRTDKRRKTRLRKNINDDMVFAHEINSEDLSSVENSPSMNSLEDRLSGNLPGVASCNSSLDTVNTLNNTPPSVPSTDYFDEITGRFHSTSTTDSEDSFQIVFNDSPKARSRLPSDCDSEDSFIVFEDSPDSCYTSNDVLGESDQDSDYTDSDSDLSDSGCVPIAKLSHNLSRTIGDLTDDSLYEETNVCDEVDCAVRSVCEEIPSEDLDVGEVCETKDTGLLLTETKKLLRKDQPRKKVSVFISFLAVLGNQVSQFAYLSEAIPNSLGKGYRFGERL